MRLIEFENLSSAFFFVSFCLFDRMGLMKIKMKRIDATLPMPEFATPGSFGFDLASRLDMTVAPGAIALVPSNLVMQAPEAAALLILPRSSMPRKKGLVFPHSVGLIDRDYCGETDEIMMQVMNFGDEAVEIKRGERMAQGLFVNISKPIFVEVETMNEKDRGGFGSTGA
jgi:dUTP pyrophosphatase